MTPASCCSRPTSRTHPVEYAAATQRLRDAGDSTQSNIEALRDLYQHKIDATDRHAQCSTRVPPIRVADPGGDRRCLGLGITGLMLRGAFERNGGPGSCRGTRSVRSIAATSKHAVQRGLEMTRTEEAAYEVMGSALEHVVGDRSAEMLISDSSGAHFRQVLATGTAERVCTVERAERSVRSRTPARCASSRTARTSTPVRSCVTGPGGPCAGGVPSRVGRRAIDRRRPRAQRRASTVPHNSVTDLTLVAQRAGEHVGLLRVDDPQRHAGPYRLPHRLCSTGAASRRRPISSSARERRSSSRFADLDHFKILNDTHGHESGDRALRLFARVLRDSVRPDRHPGPVRRRGVRRRPARLHGPRRSGGRRTAPRPARTRARERVGSTVHRQRRHRPVGPRQRPDRDHRAGRRSAPRARRPPAATGSSCSRATSPKTSTRTSTRPGEPELVRRRRCVSTPDPPVADHEEHPCTPAPIIPVMSNRLENAQSPAPSGVAGPFRGQPRAARAWRDGAK